MTSATAHRSESESGHADDESWLSHRQVLTILSGLLLGMFLAALDQNIVSVAIVKIANSLHGFNQQAWATTAYLITATITTPLYGKLADIYGRKPFYLTAITLFVAGSAACTFATSMYELAGFRAFQGLGAGGLMSLAFTIIGDIVPPRERVRYQGYFMMTFGIATVLGPVLGGFLSGYDHLGGIEGWRWVFLVNVPIGVIAFLVVGKVLNVPMRQQSHRIDWFGALALTICVVPLLIVAEQGRDWGWSSTRAVICYAVASFGLILFLFVEYVMKDAALIPLRLFRNSTFSVAIAGSAIIGVAMFGGITMVPQYFQVVRGYSPTNAGLLMLPLVLGIMIGSQLSGRITKNTGRYKILPVIGTFVVAVGAVLYAQVHYDSPLWQPLAYALVLGLGLGGCMQTLIIAAQNAGPRADMGVSTAAATFFRQMGGTLGVAVFLTILFNLLPHRIIDAFDGRLPEGFDIARLGTLQTNTSGIADMPDQIRIPILTGFTNAMHGVFYTSAAVALLACVVLMFLKEIPLQRNSNAPTTGGGGESVPGDGRGADHEASAAAAAALPEPAFATSTGTGRHAQPASPERSSNGQVNPVTTPMPMIAADSAEIGGSAVAGHIRRADGRSIPDAALTLVDQRGHQVTRVTGGPAGEYTIAAPRAGTYVLIAAASGHQPQAVSLVVGHGPARLDLTLVGSGELTGVVRVAGRRDPIVGAMVTLTDSRGEVVDAAITGSDGSYVISGVGSGGYTLVAGAERMQPVATTVTVPDTGMLSRDIELAPTVVLAGSARTAGDRAVPDARITVVDPDGNVAATTRTDDDGHYVVTDLAEGEYTVVASGYPPVTSRVVVRGEVAHNVTLGYEAALDEQADRS